MSQMPYCHVMAKDAGRTLRQPVRAGNRRGEVVRTATCFLALIWMTPFVDRVAAQSAAAQVTLSFKAPGDDRSIGRAAVYEIRYGLSPITALNWNQASRVPEALPPPSLSGILERITVSVPNAIMGTKYYLALRARDEVYNWSIVTNSVYFTYGVPPGTDESSITWVR